MGQTCDVRAERSLTHDPPERTIENAAVDPKSTRSG